MSLKSSRKKSEPKDAPYAQNKKAFDEVMLHFRRMNRPMVGAFGAINSERSGSRPTLSNPVQPSSVDFWCDVLKVIIATKPKQVPLWKFFLAYMLFDSDNDFFPAQSEIERNTFAARAIGPRVHSVEQRLGAEFIRRAIWPLGSYLNPPRPGRKF